MKKTYITLLTILMIGCVGFFMSCSNDSKTPTTRYEITTEIMPAMSGTVTLDPEGGTYDVETEVTLTATPMEGFSFANWSGDIAGIDTTDTIITVSVDGDKMLVANFEATPMSLSPLQIEINALVRSFIEEIGARDFDTTLKPSVLIFNTPNLIFYSDEDKLVIAPEWETLSDESKNLFNDWAARANSDTSDYMGESFTGEKYFTETFSWFFVFHELGHYIQDILTTPGDRYFWEAQANDIALAFLKINERERLDEYMLLMRAVIDILPVPADTSRMYFNNNYEEIGTVPAVYGWFQFYFTLQTYENRIDAIRLEDYLSN